MKESYDVVVIGAGIGGLSAGALLAKKGLSVAVFESQPVAGGYCTSFRRKGFTFDSCLDAISGCGDKGWLKRILKKIGVEDEVEFVRLDPLRVDNFGGDIIPIPGEIGAYKDLLLNIAPGERDGIEGLFRTMTSIFRTAMVTTPETLYSDPRLDGRGDDLAKFRRLTYKALLDDFVKDHRVRAVLSDRSAFMGLQPSKVSAVALVTMLMTFADGGGYRIKDGAQKLAGAFVKGLKDSGGELFLRKPVTEIVSENGRATGVMVGEHRVKAKAVISGIDATKTCKMTGLGVDDTLKPSTSFFMVYLGLGKDIDMPDSMGFYPGYDIEGTFADTSRDIASPRASVEIINYSRISPGMAPAGCSTVMLMSKAAYAYGKPWHSCKREEMDRLIGLAGNALPVLVDNITYAEAATPLTLERYTANVSGAAFGWEQGPYNKRSGSATALPGLFMVGHWTYPGGGIESVAASGLVAAEKAASAI